MYTYFREKMILYKYNVRYVVVYLKSNIVLTFHNNFKTVFHVIITLNNVFLNNKELK